MDSSKLKNIKYGIYKKRTKCSITINELINYG